MGKNNIFKITLLASCMFFLGLYLGASVLGEYNTRNSVDIVVKTILDESLKLESDSAMSAYIHLSEDAGLQALSHFNDYIDIYVKYIESTSFKTSKNIFSKDKALTNIRMGFLYEKKGDIVRAQEYIEKGWELYGADDRVDSKEKLLDLVRKLDLKYIELQNK